MERVFKNFLFDYSAFLKNLGSCYRFDSKRFCRDCRRNVIREFKELKELKRMRKEPHCTSWFCVADTAFQYEVCGFASIFSLLFIYYY